MEARGVIGRLRRDLRSRLVVMVGMATFVVGVYVVVVLGGGALIGRTDSPSLPLSVVATAAVALLFAPVQAAFERAATRFGQGRAATPYDVLSRFSGTVTGGYPTEELPGRMAMLLAQGTGAQWAQVWLNVSDQLTLAATWPVNAGADPTPPDGRPDTLAATCDGRRALAVRHGDQLLGVLVALPDVEVPMGTRPAFTDEQVTAAIQQDAGQARGLRGKVLLRARVALVQLALASVPPRADPGALGVPDHL